MFCFGKTINQSNYTVFENYSNSLIFFHFALEEECTWICVRSVRSNKRALQKACASKGVCSNKRALDKACARISVGSKKRSLEKACARISEGSKKRALEKRVRSNKRGLKKRSLEKACARITIQKIIRIYHNFGSKIEMRHFFL